ncbi:hypothetical protein SVIO_103800 [Streptomyces violaceusniger]|uniref:Major facilitator superfamily (MFS) profile domain-containing protein n=1 Tax=Streptomyces violaceusniger TaxID=68280 RepID=A0A4D4LN75_STRVO|nr:hypothetical protein SVIO_103800 [Streptomyces violaceusniger]
MGTDQPPQAAAGPVSGGCASAARRLRAILITVSIALMGVIASVSGLNVAQTHMAVEWGASQTTVLWIINIYTLALAALLLPLGAIGDRLGRKPMLIAGLIIFGAAGVVAGLAPSAAVMIGARVAAGIGAAMIMPITLAVITSTFPEPKNQRQLLRTLRVPRHRTNKSRPYHTRFQTTPFAPRLIQPGSLPPLYDELASLGIRNKATCDPGRT